MSSTDTIPVLIRMPSALLARVDSVAEANERSRAFILKKAAAAFCDALEIPPGAVVDAAADAAAGACAPSRLPAAPYPGGLHIAAMQRQAAAKRAQTAAHAAAHDRAVEQTAAALKGTTP